MIWDDPWVLCAMHGGTTIPPPPTPLATGQRFACVLVADLDLQVWIDIVGTRWTAEELQLRLQSAWVPCLFLEDVLVATCVVRPKDDVWILETLRARKGFGTPLLRAVIPWLFHKHGGPYVLGYTWELSIPGLIGAWAKGWLGSATEIQYGWAFASPAAQANACGFCPHRWEPLGPRLALPTYFKDASGSAIVSDSGLGDGWGYVATWNGSPDWTAIASRGGWRSLWIRSRAAPTKNWSWTGEIVVVGLLNFSGVAKPRLDWVTAEIA